MTNRDEFLTKQQTVEAQGRRLTAMHLQEIESNPLDADQVAMFEMFEQKGWSHEKRLSYIQERANTAALVSAAE